jgi:choline dehydrogenase-like flavoprotein
MNSSPFETPATYDTDVIIIGSGFGGSVAALGLAEKGYAVLVLEAGRRFADADFAKTSWDVKNYLWAPGLGCYGVQRIHKLPDVMILAGAGVGGGSLNYANTLYRPPRAFYDDPQWRDLADWEAELAPHYDTASRMLGVVDENPCDGPVEQDHEATRRWSWASRARIRQDSCRCVSSAPPVSALPDPYFGGAGPARTGCTMCGNCMVGCRDGAKNTLVKNYLALAERLGVHIEPTAHGHRCAPGRPRAPRAGVCRDDRAHRRVGAQGPSGHDRCPGDRGGRRVGDCSTAAVTQGAGRLAGPIRPARGSDSDQLGGTRRRDGGPRAPGRGPHPRHRDYDLLPRR